MTRQIKMSPFLRKVSQNGQFTIIMKWKTYFSSRLSPWKFAGISVLRIFSTGDVKYLLISKSNSMIDGNSFPKFFCQEPNAIKINQFCLNTGSRKWVSALSNVLNKVQGCLKLLNLNFNFPASLETFGAMKNSNFRNISRFLKISRHLLIAYAQRKIVATLPVLSEVCGKF